MDNLIKKPKYLIYAEQAQARKEAKYKAVFDSPEFATYLLYRKKRKLPDLPPEELYPKFLRSKRAKELKKKNLC